MIGTDYEIAVGREEAEELADRIAAALPEMALPGARSGVGITALMILMRRMIDGLPVADRPRMRAAVAYLIEREKWTV
jgi:hypothetical protein